MQAIQSNNQTGSAFDQFFSKRAAEQSKTIKARTAPVTHKFAGQPVKFGGAVKRTLNSRKNKIAEREFNQELPDNHSILVDAIKTQYADISDVEAITDDKRKPYDRYNALMNVRNSVIEKVTSQANALLNNVGEELKRHKFDKDTAAKVIDSDLLRFQVNITECVFGSDRQKVYVESYAYHDAVTIPVLEYKQELLSKGRTKEAKALVSVYATLIGHLASLGTGFHAEHTAEMLFYEPLDMDKVKCKDDKLALMDFFDQIEKDNESAVKALLIIIKYGALEEFKEFLMINGFSYDESEKLTNEQFVDSIQDNGMDYSLADVVCEYLEPSMVLERYGLLRHAIRKESENGCMVFDVKKAHRKLKRNKSIFRDFALLDRVFSAANEIKQPTESALEYLNEGTYGASAIIIPMKWGNFRGTALGNSVDQFIEGEMNVGEGCDIIGFHLDSDWQESLYSHLMATAMLAALKEGE